MVVTRLWEVTNKGKEALTAGTSSNPTSPSRPVTTTPARTDLSGTEVAGSSTTDDSSYWNSAVSSMKSAATSVSGMVSTLYGTTNTSNSDQEHEQRGEEETSSPYHYYNPLSLFASAAAAPITSRLKSIDEKDYHYDDEYDDEEDSVLAARGSTFQTPSHLPRRASTASTAWANTPQSDLLWMFRHNKNPYNAVRGRDTEPSSMTAVRSLVALVPNQRRPSSIQPVASTTSHGLASSHLEDETEVVYGPGTALWEEEDHAKTKSTADLQQQPENLRASPPPPPPLYELRRERSDHSHHAAATTKSPRGGARNTAMSASETASQLAEGTLRALRDLALDEAVELQAALRFWSDRWERPLLSWLEAGPLVWTSPRGYNHREVGRKVSQIQAVLARRCAAVGELQQQLLRAGWHRGVAQWGVLGQGGQIFAPVAGFDGGMPPGNIGGHPFIDERMYNRDGSSDNLQGVRAEELLFSPEFSIHKTPTPSALRQTSDNSETGEVNLKVASDVDRLLMSSSRVGVSESAYPYPSGRVFRRSSQAQVYAGKKHGEGIFVDDPGFLAEWSVEAIALVRRLLFRAGNGRVPIPCETNWIEEDSSPRHGADNELSNGNAVSRLRRLPLWASEVAVQRGHDATPPPNSNTTTTASSQIHPEAKVRITITDVPLLVAEVEELLDIMEGMMGIQRQRRLERLRPPSWLRSNWYIVATVAPSLAFLFRRLRAKGYGKQAIRFVVQKVSTFFRERVVDPVVAIFNEVWRGRESFSDKKARMEAVESLKKMIRSWLDDTFPEMPEAERIALSEAMDVTMVEKVKEQSMRTFYEINNVVRMSFIEMQYMKKEMMNALHAMDEMMSANDINMNLAAITPAVLLVYGSVRIFRFLFYALLKLGKSREETYASFRHILTDIERLLVMRDNPPLPPPSFNDGNVQVVATTPNKPCVLGSDDLGMLMLLIHECRSILWKDRRRFSQAVIRSVSEDLAELAGERGAVSVQQQLRITGRMCRSYPFLKVVSIGHLFQYERLDHTIR